MSLLAGLLAACSHSVGYVPAEPTGAPSGSVHLSVSSLVFRTDSPVTVKVSQSGYGGAFTQTNTCSGIAKVKLENNAGGSASLVVTPIAAGKCTITVTGGGGQSAKVSVEVSPSPVEVSPASLSFAATGPAAAQTVSVSQAGFSGSFTQTDTCNATAIVVAVSNAKGKASYKVTPIAKGGCTISFAGGVGEDVSLWVAVKPLGEIVVEPSSLGFDTTGSAAAKAVSVTQSGYRGRFAEASDCKGIAGISASVNQDGSARYTVTPLAKGDCTIAFTGGGSTTAKLPVSVAPPGSIEVTPWSLEFTDTHEHAVQTADVAQADYHGSFKESNTCARIATLTEVHNGGGSASYDVRALAKGKCTVTFTGGAGATADLSVRVQPPGKVLLAPSSLTFNTTSTAGYATATQSGYAGRFTERDDCGPTARVAATVDAAGTATYEVMPLAKGTCTATITGGNLESAPLAIAVVPYGLVVLDPSSLSFTATGSSSAQTVAVSQENFTGSFTESDDCTGVAKLSAGSNAGGKASYTVTPEAEGACEATFAGGNAVKAQLPISVTPYGPVVAKPSSLSFTATGSGAAQSVALSQSNYKGSFGESDDCSGTATIAVESNGGGTAGYTVTPLAKGDCSVTFTGGNAASTKVSISVAPYGPVVVAPSSLTFTSTGESKSVVVTQSGYSGSFTETDDCSGTATIGGPVSGIYAVSSVAAGSCTAVFTGGNGETAPLSIVVSLPGGVVASPAPLAFSAIGAASTVTETVTQSKYGGTFTQSNTCSGRVKITQTSNAGGSATYLMTPLAVGICAVTFTGGNSETFQLHVSVTLTKVGVNVGRRP